MYLILIKYNIKHEQKKTENYRADFGFPMSYNFDKILGI